MVKPRGGRGQRAPYETTQMRVPIPIKPELESLIAAYRKKVLPAEDEGDRKIVLPAIEDQDDDQDDDQTDDQDDDQTDDQDDDQTDPTDLETIRDQARIIQELRTEVQYLNLKFSNPIQPALELVDRFIEVIDQTDKLHTRNNVNLVKLRNWLQELA